MRVFIVNVACLQMACHSLLFLILFSQFWAGLVHLNSCRHCLFILFFFVRQVQVKKKKKRCVQQNLLYSIEHHRENNYKASIQD